MPDIDHSETPLEILYSDRDILVCIKPARILSTDEPGGLPSLVRTALGYEKADVRTVHRLDRVVSGVMVLARNAKAASELSRQIREDVFQKEYLAVVHGRPGAQEGVLKDLLLRDKARKMTMVVTEPGKDVQPAALRYQILGGNQELTRVRIQLETGRTHQIRVQFASRGFPLVGERKYSELNDPCEIALWSYRLAFTHPITGQPMEFVQDPPAVFPWTEV
jgi:23S rRNA pseudouridine1911/1915/1917 synthase